MNESADVPVEHADVALDQPQRALRQIWVHQGVTVEQVAAAVELYQRAVLVTCLSHEFGEWAQTPAEHMEGLTVALQRMQTAWEW